MQIALAVKNVPFDEIVFVQYPVVDDPYDPNRVVPDYDAADQLWAALAANQPITLTSDPNAGGGVITVDPVPTDPATPDPAADARRHRRSDRDGDRTARLDRGHDRGAETCSAGNLRG